MSASREKDRCSLPSAEDHWFTREPDTTFVDHEQTISATRAVEEALSVLGAGAGTAEVQKYLADLGLDCDVPMIERICSQIRRPSDRSRETAKEVRPTELVKTEAEPVPPPRHESSSGAGQGTTGVPGAAGRPSDLVKTEADTVPPPQHSARK